MTFWNYKASIYTPVRKLPPFKNILQAETTSLQTLVKKISKPIYLQLDLGTGTGDSLGVIARPPLRICIDGSLAMLNKLTESHKLQAEAEHIPFQAQTFGLVSAIGLLEYISDTKDMLNEVYRILQPQGYFLFTTSPPNVYNQLRRLLGESLTLQSLQNLYAALPLQSWNLIARSHTLLQDHWLIQKTDITNT